LGHQDDGKVGVDAEAEAIGRRVGPTPVADGREELGPAGAGLALKLIGLRMPPNDADPLADASGPSATAERGS
jgi:hypothetical protein